MNQTYTVKAGDTLYGISNQFGVSVTELANLNNVNASNLQIGQVLIIPTNSGTNPNTMFMYTVKKGDSLYSIAKKYNTTVQEIINLNNLKSNVLQIGQVLRIPEMYTPESEMVVPNFTSYTVKKGDSLYSIANRYNTSVSTIMNLNNLKNTNLSIGQQLKIPSSNNTSTTTYIVKSGDNLYAIAKKFNTTVDTIKRKNSLTSNLLSIGQKLII